MDTITIGPFWSKLYQFYCKILGTYNLIACVKRPAIPEPVRFATPLQINAQTLWFVGGEKFSAPILQETIQVYSYGSWKQGPSLPASPHTPHLGRITPCVVRWSPHEIAVFGGMTQVGVVYVRTTFIYNTKTESWREMEQFGFDHHSPICGSTTMPNDVTMLVIAGGSGNLVAELFRSDTLQWSRAKDLPVGFFDIKNTVNVNGKIVLYAYWDKMYEFDPDTEDWNEVGTWPNPGNNIFAVGILYNYY